MDTAPGLRCTRRRFLATAVGASFSAGLISGTRAGEGKRLRAVIIGHTGRGDYGHGYDQAFTGVEQVEVAAVADPDAAGAHAAAARAGAPRTYADYREALRREQPQLAVVAMRHPRLHREVVLACAEAGVHFLVEKPITETLPEADEVLEAVKRKPVQVVVAHNRRYTLDFQRLGALLAEGFVGQVREIHIHGKQDARAGGEDMAVLGTHDFDLLRHFFGNPRWCSADVLVDGRPATLADARDGREPIRVLGDTVRARFAFPQNVSVTWDSVATRDGWNQPPPGKEHWAWEILGTRRVIGYQSGAGFAYLDSPYLLQPSNSSSWQALPEPREFEVPAHHRHLGRDLVHAVETGAPTLCGAEDGCWAIEMLTAVYRSHLSGSRVEFPLRDRSDPLA